jgi:acyl-CoA thioesterase-1
VRRARHRPIDARVLALTLLALAAPACGRDSSPAGPGEPAATATATAERGPQRAPARPAPGAAAAPSAPSPAPADPVPLVVFLGDSLTAGLGLAEDEAWPSVLAAMLAADGTPIRAVNAGVSGDTSAGGLRRLPWQLRQRPDVVVVELGANDGLRGQPVSGVESNLREVISRSRAAGARVLLVGMRVPPSLGERYADDFAAVYPRLARELGVPLVPFLLAGVAADPGLNQADGMHPNAEGHRRVAAVVRPYLEGLLRESPPGAAAAAR